MTRVGPDPLFLSIDDFERMLERSSRSSRDSYPPYNIECIRDENGEVAQLSIVLAVAGFTRDQLEIVLENNDLVIRGEQTQDSSRDYLYRGIAARRFQRSFVLVDGLKVQSAQLNDGLLAIELTRPDTVKRIKKIEIKNRP